MAPTSVSDIIKKGQGFRLAWKPVIDITDDSVRVSLPHNFILLNSAGQPSEPTSHAPELFITADLDTALYLDSAAQEFMRTAAISAVQRYTSAGLDGIRYNASARWALQADIEASARWSFENIKQGVEPVPSCREPALSTTRLLPTETSAIVIVSKPQPTTTDENLGPLSQSHQAMPPHALFLPSMSLVFGSNGWLDKVRSTMPSLVVAETGAGPLTGEIDGKIDNSLLEQMARRSVTILQRLYARRGPEARSETMGIWLRANCETASGVLGNRIDALLGQANATEIAILQPQTCTLSLSTQRAIWPLSSLGEQGPVFEIVAGPTKAAVEADQ